MPKPVPSPLRSAVNWFRTSHLRLLVAGLVAIGLVGAITIFAAPAPTAQIKVWVNPTGQTPGKVNVQIGSGNGGTCSEMSKSVGSEGYALFGGCTVGRNYHAVVTPVQFTVGSTVWRTGQQSQSTNNLQRAGANNPIGWAPQFSYAQQGAGGGAGGGTGTPSQTDDRAQVTVWVNPRPVVNGTKVKLTGADCNNQGEKTVNSTNKDNGQVVWGNCKVGQQVTVSVPKSQDLKAVDDIWNYRIGSADDNSEVQKLTVNKNDNQNNVNFHYYGGFTATQGDKTAQIKVVVNPADKTPGKLDVLIYGGKCNVPGSNGDQKVHSQTKPVGPEGYALFGGCEVGAGYRVKLLQPGTTNPGTQFTDAAGTWLIGPIGPDRYLPHLDPGNPISWTPGYEFTLQAAPSPTKGSLTVKSFNDANCNKTQDPGEATLPNAPYSYSGPNNAKADLNTGSGGTNTTADLEPGSYQVKTSAPAGFQLCSGETQDVTVQPGQTATVSFGYQAIPTPADQGTIVALVFEDKNGNGNRDSDEPGLKDVNVITKTQAEEESDTEPNQAKTDTGITLKTNDQGEAVFSELPNGGYTVSAEPLEGYASVTAAVENVTVNDDSHIVEFGQQRQESDPEAPADQDASSGPGTGAASQGGLVQGLAGALPKTGQAGLILFLSFLAAAGLYYGIRKFLHRNDAK